MSKEYQKITVPVSGYVNSISVNTIGETVTSAEQLVTIVPDNTPVEMVCHVKNMDIADVPDEINVVSGLSGSVEIKIDKRTVMEYFLDPIMKESQVSRL